MERMEAGRNDFERLGHYGHGGGTEQAGRDDGHHPGAQLCGRSDFLHSGTAGFESHEKTGLSHDHRQPRLQLFGGAEFG